MTPSRTVSPVSTGSASASTTTSQWPIISVSDYSTFTLTSSMTATASLTRTRTATLSAARTKTASSSSSVTSSSSASGSVTGSSRATGSDTASASTSASARASKSYASLSASASWASETQGQSASSTRSITFSSTNSQTSSLSITDTLSASVSKTQSTSASVRTTLISSATNKPSDNGLRSFSPTVTSTMSSTSSTTPTPSTTKSLGVQRVEETLSIMGVKFELTVSPLTADTLTVSTAFALRSWAQKIVFALPSSVSIDPLLNSHVIDSVFISAVYEVSTGITNVLNTSDVRNTIGNVYNSTGEILKVIGMGGAPLITAITPTSSSSSSSSPSSVPIARRLGNLIESPYHHYGSSVGSGGVNRVNRRRRLIDADETFILTLDPTFKSGIATGIALTPDEVAETDSTVVFLFNILVSSSVEATKVVESLTTGLSQESLIAVGVSYVQAEVVHNYRELLITTTNNVSSSNTTTNTSVILSAKIESGSVTQIVLVVTRSFWGVFLEWLVRNVLYVLLGTSIIIISVFAMTYLKAYRQARADRATAKHLQAMVSAHTSITRHARQSNIKAKMLRALRRYTTLGWWVKQAKLAALNRPPDFYLKLPSVLSMSGSGGGGGGNNSFMNNNKNVTYEGEEEELGDVTQISVSPEGVATGRAHFSSSPSGMSSSQKKKSVRLSPKHSSTNGSAENTSDSNIPFDASDAMLVPTQGRGLRRSPPMNPSPSNLTASAIAAAANASRHSPPSQRNPGISTAFMESIYLGGSVSPLLKAQLGLGSGGQRTLFPQGHAYASPVAVAEVPANHEYGMASGELVGSSQPLQWEGSPPSYNGGGGGGGGARRFPASLEVSQRAGLSPAPVRNALGSLGNAIILRPEAQRPQRFDRLDPQQAQRDRLY